MASAREAFDRHAALYDRAFAGGDIRSEIWDLADRVFAPGMNLLDLGCGTGDDSIHFAQRGLNVTAIDISAEMISQLQRKQSGAIHSEWLARQVSRHVASARMLQRPADRE